jgi:hypothetical protein
MSQISSISGLPRKGVSQSSREDKHHPACMTYTIFQLLSDDNWDGLTHNCDHDTFRIVQWKYFPWSCTDNASAGICFGQGSINKFETGERSFADSPPNLQLAQKAMRIPSNQTPKAIETFCRLASASPTP